MPYFPTVEETKTAQQVTDVFRGYHCLLYTSPSPRDTR